MKNIQSNLKIRSFDHIGIRVSDKKISLGFYQLLGFFSVPSESYPEYKTKGLMNENGLYLYLIEGAEKSSDSHFNILMDGKIKPPGLTHLALVIDNVIDAINFFKKHDVAITGGILEFERRKVIFIRDPDGNVIEFDQLL